MNRYAGQSTALSLLCLPPSSAPFPVMPAKQPADRGRIHRRVPASVSPACPYGRNAGKELAKGRGVGPETWQGRGGTKGRNSAGRVLCCRYAYRPNAAAMTGLLDAEGSRRQSFLKRRGFNEFRSLVQKLREQCPTGKPVVIRTSWMHSAIQGACIRRKSRFVIRLNNRLDEQEAIETVLHEWAHALAWNYSLDRLAGEPGTSMEAFNAASHDEAWGCAYSRVWRVYSGAA